MHVRHLKILALSLLALVGTMAVSASAAQAEWELVGGTNLGEGVLELKLTAEVLTGEILFAGVGLLGASPYCPGGTASVVLKTVKGMTMLTGSASVSFDKCTILELPDCTIKSLGQMGGTIVLNSSGEAKMISKTSKEVSFDFSSANFTEFRYEGELCPFDGMTGSLKGTLRLAMADPTASVETQLATLDDVSLKYGEGAVEFHAGHPKTTTPIALDVKKVGGGNWAIKLIASL